MNKAFTIIELLISASVSMVILAMFVQQISYSSKVHLDNSMIQKAHNEAQAVINIIGIDLRMIGNGIPFEVHDFDIGITLEDKNNLSGIPDITYPILINDTSNTQIKYRLNETGNIYMISSDFVITNTTFNIILNEVSGLFPGDRIYMTNKSLTGYDGFWGRIQNNSSGVNSGTSTITIDATNFGYWKSPGSSFNAGSILEPVADITLANEVVGGINLITKDNGFNKLTLARNATFQIRFFKEDGTEINRIADGEATTLIASDLQNRELKYIQITVNVSTDNNLKAIGNVGAPYTASITQSFGVKNLRTK